MQLTPEILKERKTGIGGSDCAAVMGLNKFSTPLDIYLSKIDPDYKIEQNEAMKDGQDLEHIVIKRYIEATNFKVEEPNKVFKNEKYPWLLANVDGIVVDKNIILEAKTTGFFSDEWGEPGTDYIPTPYLYQVAHYCLVLDKPSADIAGWSYGKPLRIYHYHRDKALEQQIIDATHDFWHNNVLKQIPPEPANIEDVKKLYPHADESKIIVADEQIAKYSYEHNQLKMQIKKLEKQKDFFEYEIKKFMGNAAFLVDVDGTKLIDYKEIKTNKFQQKKFSASNCDLYEQYCEPSSYRKFDNKIK